MLKISLRSKLLEPIRAGRAKLQIFSTVSFAAVFLTLLFTNTFVSNLSLHSFAIKPSTRHSPLHKTTRVQLLKATSRLPFPKELVEEDVIEDRSHEAPPPNLTSIQRLIWFREKLAEFEILGSSEKTDQFENRASEFLKDGCSFRFFMTWISPATGFGEREFLATEALFKAHPNGCLIILSRTMDSVTGFRILEPLIDLRFRVQAMSPDLSFLLNGTPAKTWFDQIREGEMDPGEIPLAQNLSNLIRLAILYRYGGVYLDADFVILKDFSGLRNSIGAQSVDGSGNWTRLNNAVMIFDRNHPLLREFMREFASGFDGNKWGHNGPYLVSRVVRRELRKPGSNFTVLSHMAFYPLDWTRVSGLFAAPKTRAQQKWVEAKLGQLKGETYGVHLWNRESGKLKVEEGSILERLISENCVVCSHFQKKTATHHLVPLL